MRGRLRVVFVVAVVALVLSGVSQAYGSEISVAGWWDNGYTFNSQFTGDYDGTYGQFDAAWQWVPNYYWHNGKMLDEMVAELAGWANGNSFGWFDMNYDSTDPAGYHEVFAGADTPGTTAPHSKSDIPKEALFDFYMKTATNGNIWHTANALKTFADSYNYHAWVFQSTNPTWIGLKGKDYDKAYMIAWEDVPYPGGGFPWDPTYNDPTGNNWGGKPAWHQAGEPDNNDQIVFLWAPSTVGGGPDPYPEPGSLGLLSLALCSAIAVGRKRRLI